MAKAAHCNCASRGFDSRPDFTRGAACRIRGHQGRGSVRCFSFWKVNGGSAAAPAANRMGRSSSVCGSCPPPSACPRKLRKRQRCAAVCSVVSAVACVLPGIGWVGHRQAPLFVMQPSQDSGGSTPPPPICFGAVDQSADHRAFNPGVAGSNPVGVIEFLLDHSPQENRHVSHQPPCFKKRFPRITFKNF